MAWLAAPTAVSTTSPSSKVARFCSARRMSGPTSLRRLRSFLSSLPSLSAAADGVGGAALRSAASASSAKRRERHLPRAHERDGAVHRHQRVAHQAQDVRVARHERVAQRLVGQAVEDRRGAHLAPGARVDARRLLAAPRRLARPTSTRRLACFGCRECWPVLSTALRIADGSAATTDLTMRETTDFSDGNSSSGSFCALMRRGAGSWCSLISRTSTSGSLGGSMRVWSSSSKSTGSRRRGACTPGAGTAAAAAWRTTVFMKSGLGAPSSVRSLTSMSEVASIEGLDLLDVARVELQLLVDFEDVGGIIADVAGPRLFRDAILDRDVRSPGRRSGYACDALWRACQREPSPPAGGDWEPSADAPLQRARPPPYPKLL